MSDRDRILYHLRKLHVDYQQPSHSFAAFILGRLIYKRISDGITNPSQAVKEIYPYLQQFHILDVFSYDYICRFGYDWMNFSRLIRKMHGLDYLNLMHPFYIHDLLTDFKVEILQKPELTEIKLYQILMVYLMLADDSRFLPANFDLDFFLLESQYQEKMEHFGVNYSEFNEVWSSLYYSELKNQSKNLSEIDALCRLYRENGRSKRQLLEDFALKKYGDQSPQYLFPSGFAEIEGGVSEETKKMNDSLSFFCKKFQPTDMIQKLFYQENRDDHPFEISFLLKYLRFLIRYGGSVLIVNPSPLFLTKCADCIYSASSITVAVPDDTVCDLYNQQFPDIRFICFSELAVEFIRYDYVFVFARGLEYMEYRDAFHCCGQNGHLVYYGPETPLSGVNQIMKQDLSRCKIWPETILSVAREASTLPRRRIVLVGRRGDVNASEEVILLTSFVRNTYFYVDRPAMLIPRAWLLEELTCLQMRDRYIRYTSEEKGHYKDPSVYSFSREIRLHYVQLQRRDCVSAKVCYRGALTDNPKDRRVKHGKKVVGFTEKGMRCKSWEQLPERLEKAAFDDHFYDGISKDILTKFQTTSLSLKTLWYLCRGHLISYETDYHAEEMDLFFVSCGQKIRDLIPGALSGDEIAAAMQEELGEDCWKVLQQLHLVFTTCKQCGYLPEVPTGALYHSRISGGRNRLQKLRNGLNKRSLTQSQEEQILSFLMEPQGRDKTPRCVQDSIYLTGLIRLHTGMPLREVLALRWMDLYQDDYTSCCSLIITGWISNYGERVGFDPVRGRRKCRKMPLHPALADILLQRRSFLLEKLHFSSDEILDQPIVLALEPNRNRRKCAWKHCSLSDGRKISKTIVSKAEIPEDKILLLEGDDQFDQDLNTYAGDLFYANFLHHMLHTCGFSMAELSYITGVEPPDTFSGHYVDYGNSLIQYQMIRKMSRRFIKYGSNDREIPAWQYQMIHNCLEITAGSVPGSCLEVRLSMNLAQTQKDVTLTIPNCQGAQLEIRQSRTGGKT